MPGAGRRIYKPYLRHIDYTSQDFGIFNGEFKNVGKYEWSSESCDSICDIIDMPCDDSTFDYMQCTDVFENLQKPCRTIKEFSRILKKYAKMLLNSLFNFDDHQDTYFFSLV